MREDFNMSSPMGLGLLLENSYHESLRCRIRYGDAEKAFFIFEDTENPASIHFDPNILWDLSVISQGGKIQYQLTPQVVCAI